MGEAETDARAARAKIADLNIVGKFCFGLSRVELLKW